MIKSYGHLPKLRLLWMCFSVMREMRTFSWFDILSFSCWPGYHGLLHLGDKKFENIRVSNNYINGVGISRQWSTFGIFHQGSLNVRINNNEVTRTSGGGMNIIGESFARGERAEGEDYVINVEYNYVHDYGAGITNDFGGLKTGSKGYNCQAGNMIFTFAVTGGNLEIFSKRRSSHICE